MIYLSIPYTGQEYLSFRISCAIAAKLMQQGYIVFSPIAHSHPIAKYGGINHRDHAFWLKQDLEMLRLCDELWLIKLHGWEESEGVAVEIKTAIDRNMPIRSLCPLDFVSPKQLEDWRKEGQERETEA
jgi:hypothetical protein